MNEIATKIRDYLLQENYNLIESNDENSIIRYQDQVISISSENTATGFCNICLPIITNSQSLGNTKLLRLCNAITSRQKVVKAFLMEDCILLTYEFNWKEMEELHYHLKIGIEQVAASKKSIEDAVGLYQVYNMSNHKIKIMSKCNYNFDPFVANASAALYGVENQNAVQENFHELYLKLVDHFRNPEFIGKLHALKGRGQVTVAIELPMKNETVRFANKLWFQVQKSSSLYWEVYYVNIGVNFRKSTYSPFTFKKMMLSRATVGTIEKIQDRISAADFESKMCEELGKYVYECFSSETVNIMKRNDSETEEVEKTKNL